LRSSQSSSTSCEESQEGAFEVSNLIPHEVHLVASEDPENESVQITSQNGPRIPNTNDINFRILPPLNRQEYFN